MTVRAVVREWRDDEGWGVLDSPETPGGCWAHFSHVDVDGYRSLTPGQHVLLEWESAAQDGYDHRAVRVRPADEQPASPDTPAYTSTPTSTFDDPASNTFP